MVPTKRARWLILLLLVVLGALLAAATLSAQTLSENSLKGMKWRLIGPFRGGRVLAVGGVAGEPHGFYFGAGAGGVWKRAQRGVKLTARFWKGSVALHVGAPVWSARPHVIY